MREESEDREHDPEAEFLHEEFGVDAEPIVPPEPPTLGALIHGPVADEAGLAPEDEEPWEDDRRAAEDRDRER